MPSHVMPQAVLAARREFFANGSVSGDLVPAPIARSWQRCAGHGLDMTARPRVEPMTAGELRETCERHEALRRACRPEIEALHAAAAATGSIVVLTDAAGVVLDALGSVAFADRAARVALRPGVAWSEQATGTNAIGTALAERRAVEVRGAEHYFEAHRILSCAAVPILDPRGRMVGVLDVSGPASLQHLHALGLVGLAVDQIEHRLLADDGLGRCDVVRFHADPALVGTPREGVLAFDDGRLVAANRHGLALMGLGWDALGTRRFGDLFATGLSRVAPVGELHSHRGDTLHARRRAAPGAARRNPEPLFDADTRAARDRAVRLADADVPVLLHGETGSGKEVLAREIHARSGRADKPFVAVNCAAVPESLIESELFGYEEGAFTGARRQGAKGLLRAADGGVLFLDEIGDMPLALQARLLRVLQEREVTPLGGGRAVAVDFALVCATHRDLKALVAAGAFRADLYFRIAQYTVTLPALRDLPDRAAVVRALWCDLGGEPDALAPEALHLLAAHDWPGNYRQLVGVLRTLLVLAEPGRPLSADDLPAELRRARADAVEAAAAATVAAADAPLDAITREAMRQALAAAGGNVSQAARRLGVNRSTLYRRLLNGEDAGRN